MERNDYFNYGFVCFLMTAFFAVIGWGLIAGIPAIIAIILIASGIISNPPPPKPSKLETSPAPEPAPQKTLIWSPNPYEIFFGLAIIGAVYLVPPLSQMAPQIPFMLYGVWLLGLFFIIHGLFTKH